MLRSPSPTATRRSVGPGDLRQGNLTEILRFVRDHGPSSRQAIAEGCGLGTSTLTDLLGELRSRGLVRELGPVRRVGAGRPTRPLCLDGEPWGVLGVQLDAVGAFFVCTTVGGRELWREQVPLPLRHAGPVQGLRAFREALGAQLRRLPAGKSLVAVHLGLPGLLSPGGTLGACPTLGWEGLDLRAAVGDTVHDAGRGPVAVGIDDAGHLAALQAVRVDLPAPMPDVAVYLGGLRGVSGGVVLGGAVFRGADGGAGAVGHVRVQPDGPRCVCGRHGCLESLLGPVPLLAGSGLVSPEEAERLTDLDPVGGVELLAEAAREGHPGVRRVLAQGAAALAVALDGIIGTLNPQVVVLGGFLGVLRPWLAPALEEAIDARASFRPRARTQLLGLGCGTADRVVLGAVLAARDAVLQDPLNLTSPL